MTAPAPPQGPPPGLHEGTVGPTEREGRDYEVIWRRRGRGTVIGVAVVVLAIVIAFVVAWRVFTGVRDRLDPPGPPGDPVVIELAAGSTTSGIADTLEDFGVIESATLYEWYIRLKGGASFQAGEYTFFESSAPWEVLDVLRSGPDFVLQVEQITVTIPEGFTLAQLEAELDDVDRLPFSGADFVAELRRNRFTSSYAPPPAELPEGADESWEGLLFPDTYFVAADSTPEDLVRQMVARFDQILRGLGYANTDEVVGLNAYETVIVASLIEREARVASERAKISRVIHNRLAAGWPLGIDATIVYATGDNVLTVSELEAEGPYNSRLNLGLPPTPIAFPGEAALEAALYPATGQWRYYVLADEDGRHAFSVSAEEFERDKLRCQERGLCG